MGGSVQNLVPFCSCHSTVKQKSKICCCVAPVSVRTWHTVSAHPKAADSLAVEPKHSPARTCWLQPPGRVEVYTAIHIYTYSAVLPRPHNIHIQPIRLWYYTGTYTANHIAWVVFHCVALGPYSPKRAPSPNLNARDNSLQTANVFVRTHNDEHILTQQPQCCTVACAPTGHVRPAPRPSPACPCPCLQLLHAYGHTGQRGYTCTAQQQ